MLRGNCSREISALYALHVACRTSHERDSVDVPAVIIQLWNSEKFEPPTTSYVAHCLTMSQKNWCRCKPRMSCRGGWWVGRMISGVNDTVCVRVSLCSRSKRTRSIWKMLGPFATASRRTPFHQMSLAVLSRAACASMSTTTTTDNDDNDNDNDNAWQRGQLWPHGMGPKTTWAIGTCTLWQDLGMHWSGGQQVKVWPVDRQRSRFCGYQVCCCSGYAHAYPLQQHT